MTFDPERHAHRLAKLGWLLAVGGMIIGGWIGSTVAVGGGLLLLFACVSNRDGFLLVGPIAPAEWNRIARKGRPWVWRSVYALAAAVIVVGNLNAYGGFAPALPRSQVTLIAEQIGNWFAVCLFLYVSVLAVQVYATGIPDDRAAKRWDVLRTTDLRPREILIGKFVGKLPVLFDPLLTATPVLMLLPLFGGVSAWFPAAVLACCAAVTVGLGGVALFYSVFCKTGRQAIGQTILLVVLYLFTAGIVHEIAIRMKPTGWPGLLARIGEALAAGNPILHFSALTRSDVTEDEILTRAGRFVLFHLTAGVLFALVAIRRMPRIEGGEWEKRAGLYPPPGSVAARHEPTSPARGEMKRVAGSSTSPIERENGAASSSTSPLEGEVGDGDSRRRVGGSGEVAPTLPTPTKPPVERPPVTDWPIVWWERYGWLSKGQAEFVRWLRLPVLILFAALTGIPCLFIAHVRLLWPGTDSIASKAFSGLILIVLLIGGLILLFPPLFRAARCVARERAAGTLEPLLLTPLSTRELLFQKWLGIVLCDWPLYQVLLAVALPAMLTGVISFVGGVVYFVGIAVTVGTLAALGLAISVRVPTPLRGTVLAAALAVLLFFGMNGVVREVGYLRTEYALAVVLPPAASISIFEKRPPPPKSQFSPDLTRLAYCFTFGVLLWGVVGYGAWRAAVEMLDNNRGWPTV